MFDENSNATATAATLVGPAGTNPALNTANLNSNQLFNQLLNVKDSRWLQLEVCREFQRGQCSRTAEDCKFAHPKPNVEVQNGRIVACYDFLKVPHLKDQLLINGRNNLAIKNLIYNQLAQPPAMANSLQMAQLMQQNQPAMPTLPYHQYYSTPLIYPLMPTADFQTLSPVAQQLALLQNQQKPQISATLPLANTLSVLAAQQQQQQNFAQVFLQQQLASQQLASQPQIYTQPNATSPPVSNPALTPIQLQQQAALLAALNTQQQAATATVHQPQASANPLNDSRKRNARAAGLEENGEEKRSTLASSASTSASTTVLPSAVITSSAQQPASVTDYASLQQQLLLLNAANASNGLPNGKRHLDKNGLSANGHAIPIYATQQPSGPQFPYIGYAPVSYSGQIPPRF